MIFGKNKKTNGKRKAYHAVKNLFDKYSEKWNQFSEIYDILGPNCQIIF